MYTGLTAKLSVTTESTEQVVAYISNWSVEETRDIIEVTRMGSKFKEKMPSFYSWSASADGTADFDTASFKDDKGVKITDMTNQAVLRTAMHDGKAIEVKFFLDDNHCLKGQAIIESMSVDISAEDKGNISISLSGIGELAYIILTSGDTSGSTGTTGQQG